MIQRAALATLLLALATPPALASNWQEADCVPHRNGELRCAVQFGIWGQHRYTAHLDAYGAARNAQGRLDLWASPCGLAGTMVRSGVGVGGGGTLQVQEFNLTSIGNACIEVFVTNCTVGGRAQPCTTAFPPGTSRLRAFRG